MGLLLFNEMNNAQKVECFRDYAGTLLKNNDILAGIIDKVIPNEKKLEMVEKLYDRDEKFRKFIYPIPSFVPEGVYVKYMPSRAKNLYDSTMRLSFDGSIDFMPNYGANGYIALRKDEGREIVNDETFNGFVLVSIDDHSIVGFITDDDLLYEVI